MTREGADTAVVTSALIVSGMYLYRRLVEPIGERGKRKPTSAKSLAEGTIGRGELLPTGTWVVGFGVTYIVISILSSMSPSAGGYSAILVATTSFLANGETLVTDLQTSSKSSLAKQQNNSKQETSAVPNPEVLWNPVGIDETYYKTVTT